MKRLKFIVKETQLANDQDIKLKLYSYKLLTWWNMAVFIEDSVIPTTVQILQIIPQSTKYWQADAETPNQFQFQFLWLVN